MKKWAVLLSLAVVVGCGVNLLPTKDEWFAVHYFIMQDFEKTIYLELASEDKLKFQTMFWEARTSEARQEFQKRLEYVNKAHKDENPSQPWNSDRSRIYLLNGPPAYISEVKGFDTNDYRGGDPDKKYTVVSRSGEDIMSMTAVVWQYQGKDRPIRYTFQHASPREYRLQSIGQYEKELENFNKNTLYRIVDQEKYAAGLQSLKKII
jgi:GWxTD domain-containing protein